MSVFAALGAVAALAAGALAWVEWRRPGRLRGMRVLAAVTSVGCLLVIALGPTRPVSVRSSPVTIATSGAPSAGRGTTYGIGVAIPGAERVPDLGWISRRQPAPASVRVMGWGLDEWQWPERPSAPLPFGVEAALSPGPAGIVSIAWPSSLALGEDAVVRGQARLESGSGWVVLADAGGPLDSSQVSSQAPSFTLRARPRAAGHWRPTLRLADVPPESLAIDVRAPAPLRVLLVESSPSFETRFLRDWLAAQGASVMTRTAVSRARARVTAVNAPALNRLSGAALDSTALVVVRGKGVAALPPAERRELDDAVRERGLGLVVVGDSTPLSERFGVEVLIRDGSGEPLAEVGAEGSGRVARTSVVNSAAWKLRGDSGRYAAFWARVLGAARRPSDTIVTVEGGGPHFANRPAGILARGDPGLKAVTVEREGGPVDTVYLAATPVDSAARRGVFWPPRPGWYRVGGDAGTGFFAYDTARWVPLQARQRTEATLARVGPGGRTGVETDREPLPLWPAYLGFLLAAGVLWWSQTRALAGGRPRGSGVPAGAQTDGAAAGLTLGRDGVPASAARPGGS